MERSAKRTSGSLLVELGPQHPDDTVPLMSARRASYGEINQKRQNSRLHRQLAEIAASIVVHAQRSEYGKSNHRFVKSSLVIETG